MPRLGSGVGRYGIWVTLSQSPQVTDDSDGFFEDLNPAGTWASIRPQLSANGRQIDHVVEMRWHPQVTIDTRIVYEDANKPTGKTTRELFVKGVQNIEEANDVLVLLCEEITP